MTFEEAITMQPIWVQLWLNLLLFGAFFLPVTLLIWPASRLAGIITVLASLVGGLGVVLLYGQLGYVKLLGLPHVLIWTPVAFYLFRQIRRDDMPVWPRWIMVVVLSTILVSLLFDYADLLRYVLGERTPVPGTI